MCTRGGRVAGDVEEVVTDAAADMGIPPTIELDSSVWTNDCAGTRTPSPRGSSVQQIVQVPGGAVSPRMHAGRQATPIDDDDDDRDESNSSSQSKRTLFGPTTPVTSVTSLSSWSPSSSSRSSFIRKTPVAIKIFDPTVRTDRPPAPDHDGDASDLQEEYQSVLREASLYIGDLRHLQGSVLPECYGVWTWPVGVREVGRLGEGSGQPRVVMMLLQKVRPVFPGAMSRGLGLSDLGEPLS